jgi:DNA-binding CsgD family transcriptional regulator
MLAKCAVVALRTQRDSLVGIPMFAIVTPAVKTASSIGVEQLQKMSFTRAEAELTVQLLAGRTVSEYARMRQLAVPTVRAHLKRVMTRVGVHRQADLVRVLLNTFH